MRYPTRLIWMVTLLIAIAACSKDKTIDQPAKLTPINATLHVQRVWSASVDTKKSVPLRLGLGLAVDDGRVYAAGHKGDVVAFEIASGRVAWRTHLKAPLSGGTAVGDGMVLIGSNDGQLFALDAGSGQSRWSVRVEARCWLRRP
ncbi:MAG TPA: PQQ-binding-like beta-propeller repeat protein, partial [Steroidobacteraceae bacterium]|nr:PQQ-binding-like beta-propeller repeat protein [Steroidobacteraceae bacterium]